MSIFDSFKQRVSVTAKAAAKKSSDIVEVAKLNMAIGAEEDKIKKEYFDIGKAVYEAYAGGENVGEAFKEYCEKVKTFEENIEDMKKKIREMKSVKLCPACKAELEEDMGYCFKCGTKQEEIVRQVEEEVEVETAPEEVKPEEQQ